VSYDFTPSKELVISKVHQLFSELKWATVFSIIGFSDKTLDSIGQARVQLAILKLSEGDLDKLLYFAHVAKIDFRDVLAWAEYPNALHHTNLLNLDEKTRRDVQQKDIQQYLDWLNPAIEGDLS
jgi:hypothetical protein